MWELLAHALDYDPHDARWRQDNFTPTELLLEIWGTEKFGRVSELAEHLRLLGRSDLSTKLVSYDDSPTRPEQAKVLLIQTLTSDASEIDYALAEARQVDEGCKVSKTKPLVFPFPMTDHSSIPALLQDLAPDILHIIAHPWLSKLEPRFVFQTLGQPAPMSAMELCSHLNSLQAVVLSMCHPDLLPLFLDRAKFVIYLPFGLGQRYVSIFVKNFYSRYGDTKSVEDAFHQARTRAPVTLSPPQLITASSDMKTQLTSKLFSSVYAAMTVISTSHRTVYLEHSLEMLLLPDSQVGMSYAYSFLLLLTPLL